MSESDELVDMPEDWKALIAWFHLHYKKQLQFIDSVRRNWLTLFLAANGTGKTHVLYWCLTALSLGIFPGQQKMRMKPPLKVKILIQDFEHGMNTVAKETLFEPSFLPDGTEVGPLVPFSALKSDKIPPWSKEDKSMRFQNGSVWHFMTSEQERKLHSGTNFDVLACDEEPEEAQYDESVRGLRTAKGGGRILISMTPPYAEGKGPSWTKFKVLEPWEEGRAKEYGVIRASMHENPAITQDFIKKFSEGKTDEQVKVQVYGQYPSFGKMCHPDFEDFEWKPAEKKGNLLPASWEPPWDDADGHFEMAIDWHDSKPSAVCWVYWNKNGDPCVYEELRPQDTDGKTISEVADIIRQTEPGRWFSRKVRRFGDPKMKDKSNTVIRGFNAWDEFRNCGVHLSEGYNRQPGVGISIVNDFITGDTRNHPRLFVKETCINVRKALKNHYWLKDGTPDPKWSDYAIVVRYLLQPKARKAKQGMYRKDSKWGLTSYDGIPGYGPYTGLHIRQPMVGRVR